jgi:hypothetical protein
MRSKGVIDNALMDRFSVKVRTVIKSRALVALQACARPLMLRIGLV